MNGLPNLPTVLEEGVKGLEEGSWNAMFVPAGTPPDIVLAIQQNVAKVLADPKVRELRAAGQEPVGNSPAAFDAMFKADITRFAKVIEQAKIPKLD
jgi:tripartite-type tricarboxylate transporter receptor subunit TctC